MDSERKKEIIKKYKETTPPMGVYQVTNLKNGKRLIGSSLNVQGRINRIKFELGLGSFPDKELQKDYNESGKDQFMFETIDYLDPSEDKDRDYKEELALLEEMWLDKTQPYGESGYNIRKPETS